MSTENIPMRLVTGGDNETSRGEHKMASVKPPEQPLRCPRCDSPNTKFCYYNNYSLKQPRHFCKTCRRYWTKGGALRSVPIGGGCRKNKRTQSASRLSSGDSKDSAATSSLSGGMKLLQGLSPAMEFPFTRFHSSTNHHFVSLGGDLSSPVAGTETNRSCFVIDDDDTSGSLSGFQISGYPIGIGGFKSDGGGTREMGSMNVHNSLASSIESLSCLNQDLHWELQQQRLAMLFGGETHKDGGGGVSDLPVTAVLEQENNQAQKPQPISFQNLGISNQEVLVVSNPTNTKCGMNGAMTTEWFFENSYAPTATTTTTTTVTNNSGSNENDNTSNWNGIQAWTDLHQYNAFQS